MVRRFVNYSCRLFYSYIHPYVIISRVLTVLCGCHLLTVVPKHPTLANQLLDSENHAINAVSVRDVVCVLSSSPPDTHFCDSVKMD